MLQINSATNNNSTSTNNYNLSSLSHIKPTSPNIVQQGNLRSINSKGRFLSNNSNKIKIREHLKKVKLTKAEMNNILREIELERAKVKEQKIQAYHELSKNVDEMLKDDDVNLKKQMNECSTFLNTI